jgi:hypothetical protein
MTAQVAALDSFPVLQLKVSEAELRDHRMEIAHATDDDLGDFRVVRFGVGRGEEKIQGFFQRYESAEPDVFTVFVDMVGCLSAKHPPLAIARHVVRILKFERNVIWVNEKADSIYEERLKGGAVIEFELAELPPLSGEANAESLAALGEELARLKAELSKVQSRQEAMQRFLSSRRSAPVTQAVPADDREEDKKVPASLLR